MSNAVVKLKDVRIAELRKMMFKSANLKGGVLNFNINQSQIDSVASNVSDSFAKKWSIPTSAIARVEEPFAETVKVSLYKGGDFLKGILNLYGESCNINIEHNNGIAVMLIVFNDKLQIKILAAATITDETYDDATMKLLFGVEDEVGRFELGSEELKNIIGLSHISTNKDSQTPYVRLYTEDNFLKATDNAFDVKIHAQTEALNVDVNINKELIALFCNENHSFSVHKIAGTIEGLKLVAISKDTNTISSMVLMEAGSKNNSENIDKLSSEFNWSQEDLEL